MENKIKNRPKVRFVGFVEEWEVNNFENTFTGLPNNTLSRAELNYDFGLAKNIHYGDILIKFGEILDLEKSEVPYITNANFVDKLKKSKLDNGDIIIADAAEDEIVGKCTEILNIRKETVFSGLHTIAIRPKRSFSPMYLGYYMNSSAYHNQLLKLMQGTKVLSVSKTAIKTTIIRSPLDPTEQKKIGNYFQTIDQLIEQQQQKHDKLRILKKAMLAKMFPKEGATTPEIRFKGFTEEWVEKKLGEIVNYFNGKGHENQQGKTGKYELINLNSISIDGGLKPSGKFIDEADITLNINDLVMILSDVGHGDLLGRVAIIPKNNKYVLNQRVALLRPETTVNPTFLLYNINNNQSYFKMQGAGMSQLNLSKGSVENFTPFIPSIQEQTLIGAYFKNLDHLINQHKEKIAKLKQLKKACLHQMFV